MGCFYMTWNLTCMLIMIVLYLLGMVLVGALLAKITKNPLITGEMQPKDVANGLFEADWQQAATRLNKILKVTRV